MRKANDSAIIFSRLRKFNQSVKVMLKWQKCLVVSEKIRTFALSIKS